MFSFIVELNVVVGSRHILVHLLPVNGYRIEILKHRQDILEEKMRKRRGRIMLFSYNTDT